MLQIAVRAFSVSLERRPEKLPLQAAVRPLTSQTVILIQLQLATFWTRGHQGDGREHQVAPKDSMTSPQACSKNSTTWGAASIIQFYI